MNNPPDESAPAFVDVKTALVDGVKIHGCRECSHNYSRVVIPFMPQTHYCNSVVDAKANDMIIFNPIDIPDSCPFLIRERKPERVFIDPPIPEDTPGMPMFETTWILRSIIIMIIFASLVALFAPYPVETLGDALYVISWGIVLGIVASPIFKWIATRIGRKTP